MALKSYNQIFEEMYNGESPSSEYILDQWSVKAWKALEFFSSRKGFDAWWGNIDGEIQDEMFDELRMLLNAPGQT